MKLKGAYEEAVIFSDTVEEEALRQIRTLLDHPASGNSHVRIMPDCHAGAGCVIGYTARLNDTVIPNLIGVDIGCGVCTWNLG
ncbi:MAG: RNA-splicing ligase RtcB, partial [Spirochaetales bacterium]